MQALRDLEEPVLHALEFLGQFELVLERLDLRLVDVRLARRRRRLAAKRGKLVHLQHEEAGIRVTRRHAALDAEERVDLQLVLGERAELLGARIKLEELPVSAQLPQQPVGAAVAAGEADADARRTAAVHQPFLVVGRRTQRGDDRHAQRGRFGDDRDVARLQGKLALAGEVLDLMEQQLGELHDPPLDGELLLSGAAALFAVLQARRLALQLAQVEEPRAFDLAAGHDLDLVDAR